MKGENLLVNNDIKRPIKMTSKAKSGSEWIRNADVVVITKCPTTPCAIYYTDTLSQSLPVLCINPKHTDADTDIEKVEDMEEIGCEPAQASTNRRSIETTARSDCHLRRNKVWLPRERVRKK